MKLFARHGGYWLFWTGAAYFATGLICALFFKEVSTAIVQLGWLLTMSMPLYFPPLGRWLNMDITWDKDMFNLFGKKGKDAYTDEAKDNVYNLPKPKAVPPVVPPKPKEPDAKVYYRLGLTDNNRVAFQMGYSEITMNYEGCQQMIEQIEFFQSQLHDDNNGPSDDPDGGLPVPVPEQKAA